MNQHAVPQGSLSACLSLRDWLDRLASTNRLSVTRPGIRLVHELAAVANRPGVVPPPACSPIRTAIPAQWSRASSPTGAGWRRRSAFRRRG